MRESFEELENRGYPLVSNQVKYSLLDRSIEADGILDAAKELGITIIAYSPLEMGLLTGKFHADESLLKSRPFFRRWSLSRKIEESQALIDLLKSIADEADATPAQVALNWTVTYHGDTVVAIPGASKVSHVDQNAAAMELDLTKEQMSAIEEETQQFI
jgi:aryl-alcohol dehydrogenase-like predicted oxidoreductase